MMNRRITGLILFVSVFLMFTACAHLTTNPRSEEALRQRVTMAWEAKVKKDWGVVYDLTVEAYKKKRNRDSFVRGANINIEEFSIKEVKVIDPGRKALAVVDFKINQMGFKFNITAREKWLWENGAWHLNLMSTLGPPTSRK